MNLADCLSALPVAIASAEVAVSEVAIAGYVRPTSVLVLRGPDGSVGHGEHVGWSRAEHESFSTHIACRAWPHATVDELASSPGADENARHRRAAIEGALLDLALRQHRSPLEPARVVPMRYVMSFEAIRSPAERVRAIVERNPLTRFKVDVDPAWTVAEVAALAALDRVEILDGKGRGDLALWEIIRRAFPRTLLEDAPREIAGPHASDQALLTLDDVERAIDRRDAINVKAPRMGGFLVALRALELANAAGTIAYVGGMFEVGPGRAQARCLAALASPTAPNDLAPIGIDPTIAAIDPSPLSISLGHVGFGLP